MHRSMDLEARCQAAMEGYLCLDLFRLVADVRCRRDNLPKGAYFMAPQTVENLQFVSMGMIVLAVSKENKGNMFKKGHCRMTELPTEMWFGRQRVQSANAQLSSRAYWKAAARQMLKSAATSSQNVGTAPHLEEWPRLSDEQFHACSQRALEASLALVSWCADVTAPSLQKMYEDFCQNSACFNAGDYDLEEAHSWNPMISHGYPWIINA